MSDRNELVTKATIWLEGYAQDTGTLIKSCRVEDDSAVEKECRRALAQLLVDGDAPQKILDSLAVLIAPNDKLKNGEQLYRTDDQKPDLRLSSDHILLLRRRNNRRTIDPLILGTVLNKMSERVSDGISVEMAAHDVSEALEKDGISLKPRTIKGYWDECKPLRDYLDGK